MSQEVEQLTELYLKTYYVEQNVEAEKYTQ